MKTTLEIQKDGLTLNSHPFYLASGDMHYFRYFKGGWRRRLQLMKDFGLTAVQTYVPWNLHEPEEGEFHFEDNLDLAAFLKMCAEIGLKVMLRPAVYICSECDFGGLPYWIRNKKDVVIRSSDPTFMNCVRKYYERLTKEFVPYLSTNGGPIIAVAVENEYGSFSDDHNYMAQTGDILVELGVDVPLFTADGAFINCLKRGSLPQYWAGIDLHYYTEATKKELLAFQPDKPAYIVEFWSGRQQKWGGYFMRQSPDDVAANYESILKLGAYVNFYMFCGGTNFGFMNGASIGRYFFETSEGQANRSDAQAKLEAQDRYIPQCTSYDVDALVTEYGEPTQKYFACKKALKNYLKSIGVPFSGTNEESLEHPVKTQSIEQIKLTESADLLDNIHLISHRVISSLTPRTFEEIGQAYGFVLYRTRLEYINDLLTAWTIEGLHDRALVYAGGKYLGCWMRDRDIKPISFKVPKEGLEVDILVENLGRINCTQSMIDDYKGFIRLNQGRRWKSGWTCYSLPLKSEDLDRFDYTLVAKENRPAIFKGSFEAIPGVDTFINPDGWKKGCIFINGFNIGRYWNVGPQGTLYIPGELIKEKNTVHIFELHNPNPELTLHCDAKPSIDTLETNETRELGFCDD